MKREHSPKTSIRAAEVTLYDCVKHDPEYRQMDNKSVIPRKFPDLSRHYRLADSTQKPYCPA